MREALRNGRIPFDRPAAVVIGLAVLALVLRLAGLGGRIAHFDEGRVAYWSLHFLRTGDFHYRFIIHGPFVQHVNRVVFAVLGPNDFTMRLVVAVIGGLLPLSALLFRRHLRPVETAFLAGLLALNPVLLYYSRFFRSTVPVAAFMFVAFGLFVRAIDTRRVWYVHAGIAMTALGFTAKENAAVYLLVWVGAGLLSLDQTLFRRGLDGRVRAVWRDQLRPRLTDRRWVARGLGHVVLAGTLFAAIIVFFYAPRGGPGVGFWEGITNPGRFPAVLEATWADIRTGYEFWFGGASEPGCNKDNVLAGYVCFLGQTLEVLGVYAGPLMALAVIGFLYERYAAAEPRRLVMIAGYWGFVSVLGYPLGTDIFGAWIAVNAIVPLAVPAAVGATRFYAWARDAVAREDRIGAGLAVAVLLVLGAQTAGAAVSGVYLNPQADHNELVQYAQPEDNLRPALRRIDRLAATNDGIDVLLFGDELVANPDPGVGMEPTCGRLARVLPLQWYFAAYEANVTCALNESTLNREFPEARPPVVIARTRHQDTLQARFQGYTATAYRFRTSQDAAFERPTLFLIDEGRLPASDRDAVLVPPGDANP